jgi:hypothetical protein
VWAWNQAWVESIKQPAAPLVKKEKKEQVEKEEAKEKEEKEKHYIIPLL